MKTIQKINRTIKVDEIVMSGDIQTRGAKIIALDMLEQFINHHEMNLEICPDCPVFGSQGAKNFDIAGFDINIGLVQMPSKVKAVINVEYCGE